MKSKAFIAGLILVIVGMLGLVIFMVWIQPRIIQQSMTAMMQEEMMGGQGMMMERQGGMMGQGASSSHEWTDEEIETLRTLWIGSLPPLPPDPSNQYADDSDAAALGQRLFFDSRFSSNGQVACATCHIPEMKFTDGRAVAVGVGIAERKTMTIVGTAYSAWQFWDGRADSQWAQALGPMENPVEHGGSRTQYAHLIDQYYREDYEAIFGPLPDISDPVRFPANAGPVEDASARAAWEAMVEADRDAVNRIYANMGKAIAAYERLILPGPSRFDAYVEALLAGDRQAMEAALTPDEVAGLRLFIGQAGCTRCHNGPLFTSDSFHNTGVPPREGKAPDPGRQTGVTRLLADPFNCLGPYSDASPDDCAKLTSLNENDKALAGAFKPPTLRNITDTAPYMHAGQYGDLFSVMRHYRHTPRAAIGQTEIEPLPFMHTGMMQLEAFLHSLSGPLAGSPELLASPED